jgi:GT2 family glycosyltransferase
MSVDATAIAFDEAAYLSAFADVSVALEAGEFVTAREHFEFYGSREGRLTDERYIQALGVVPAMAASNEAAAIFVDTIMWGAGGTMLIIGWTDDRDSALTSISLFTGDRAWNTTSIARLRRTDAEAALQAAPGHLFGFWSVIDIKGDMPRACAVVVRGRRADGSYSQTESIAKAVDDALLRSSMLSYFANSHYFGSREIETFLALDSGIGRALIELNRKITVAVVAGAWVSYYGPVRQTYRGSIIVCLYGKPEFMFLQSAFFSLGAQALDYEFVYVSNSPELTESLEKEARICARIYGVSIVLVCLPGNAGFGAANNIAARYARSNRLLITNPDVFPRDNDWATRHTGIIETAPADQTLLFGAPLYYDDGSLMHHGMYFEIDAGISVKGDRIYEQPMIRTEHYGKGAPSWSRQFACPRPVPAITGAFMSADRDWFEKLGGFTEDFMFGHYEDGDLSLKSLAAGKPVWMQDFPLWHMEGKGSVRREAHEGASLVNRWLFTRRWGDLIASELRGPNPACAAFAVPPPIATAPTGKRHAARRLAL